MVPVVAAILAIAPARALAAAAGWPAVAEGAPNVAPADGASEDWSPDTRRVAVWVRASGDNGGLPFMIVDKVAARLYLFAADGTLRAATPVLLGRARGDVSPPGIGTRRLSAIKPDERITPAGRFVVEAGKNMAGQDIIWVDYDAAISLHRASDRKPGNGGRSRVERLTSPSPSDRRVSLGCVNVATAFYDRFVAPAFSRTNGIAYILPETGSVNAAFDLPPGTSSGGRVAKGR